MNIQWHCKERKEELLRNLRGHISTLEDEIKRANVRLNNSDSNDSNELPNSAGLVQGIGSRIDMDIAALHELQDVIDIVGEYK